MSNVVKLKFNYYRGLTLTAYSIQRRGCECVYLYLYTLPVPSLHVTW